MIPVVQLAQSLRYALNDMQETRTSDFELLEVINQATQLLYTRMAEQHVMSGIKIKPLITDSTGNAALPSDFVKIHQALMSDGSVAVPTSYPATYTGTYRIIGDTFYAPEGVYGLEYYYVPARVKSLADNLDVPQAMASYIERIALAIYGNNLETAETIIQTCVRSLAAREVSHFADVGPVQVLGGRI